MHAQHVLSQHHVLLPAPLVLHDEDQVEATQNGGLQVDVLRRRLHVVVPARGRVGRRHHRRARVEHRSDTRLGNGDGLLLHRLVDGHAVLGAHLVKLVDAHHAAVRKHHGSRLQRVLAGPRVPNDGGGESGSGGSLPGGVHRDGRRLVHKLQELGLGGGRVPEQQHVDVPAQANAVRENLARAAKEQAGHRCLDVVHAEDGGRDSVSKLLDDVGLRGKLLELRLLRRREYGLAARVAVEALLQPHRADVRLLDGHPSPDVAPRLGRLGDGKDAHDGDARAGHDALHERAVNHQLHVPRKLTHGHVLRVLLQLEALHVDVLGPLWEHGERVQRARLLPRVGVGGARVAGARHHGAAEPGLARHHACVLAGAALQGDVRRLGHRLVGLDDNAGEHHQLGDVVGRELANGAGVLGTVQQHLDGVRGGGGAVLVVHLLRAQRLHQLACRKLQQGEVLSRVAAQRLRERAVVRDQVINVDVQGWRRGVVVQLSAV
mmetsp:Transcript_41672/g.79644  ORF Transcript_41672/g.79644 Transcript_41672/m.79644 type:complete len:490 (+) Transcript_41672:722-2191(+)